MAATMWSTSNAVPASRRWPVLRSMIAAGALRSQNSRSVTSGADGPQHQSRFASLGVGARSPLRRLRWSQMKRMTSKKKKTPWQKLPLITCTKCKKKIPKGDTIVQIGLLYGILSAVACVPCAKKLVKAL